MKPNDADLPVSTDLVGLGIMLLMTIDVSHMDRWPTCARGDGTE